MKKLLPSVICGFLLLTAVYAQKKPVKNVSGKAHPHLAAAQKLSAQAYDKVIEAQKANEWDLQGHAAKAKELLDQVNKELKLAAAASNERKN